LESPNPGEGFFGYSVAAAGQVDGDSVPDMIVGAYFENGGATHAGRAYVFRGPSCDLLYTLESPQPQYIGGLGCSVAGAGDVNGDGCGDVVVGAHREDTDSLAAGRAYVYGGQTGGVLHTLESPDPESYGDFGCSVSAAGDTDDDGYDDIIVGASREGGGPSDAGRAYIFSGRTGTVLRTLESPNPVSGGRFGCAVSAVSDLDNDGDSDVLVGAYGESVAGHNSGMAYAFSGQTGGLLHSLQSPAPCLSGWFGASVSGAGDVNDDGCEDIAVGAPEELTPWWYRDGNAYAFDGATGDVLYSWCSPYQTGDYGAFGSSVSTAGDVDGDGYADVLVGAPKETFLYWDGMGRAYVFSGQSGSLLAIIESPSPQHEGEFGRAVGDVGDVTGDGRAEVVLGTTGEGRAYVVTFALVLRGHLSNQQLILDWSPSPGAAGYWLYGACNRPHFEPWLTWPYWYRMATLPAAVHTWSSSSGLGDASRNWFYLVVAVDAADSELARSNRVGEFDYSTGRQSLRSTTRPPVSKRLPRCSAQRVRPAAPREPRADSRRPIAAVF
jgi:hypothetical protein